MKKLPKQSKMKCMGCRKSFVFKESSSTGDARAVKILLCEVCRKKLTSFKMKIEYP